MKKHFVVVSGGVKVGRKAGRDVIHKRTQLIERKTARQVFGSVVILEPSAVCLAELKPETIRYAIDLAEVSEWTAKAVCSRYYSRKTPKYERNEAISSAAVAARLACGDRVGQNEWAGDRLVIVPA
jgi:hypothetical protein